MGCQRQLGRRVSVKVAHFGRQGLVGPDNVPGKAPPNTPKFS